MLVLKDRGIFNGTTNEHSSHCDGKNVLSIKTELKKSQCTYRTTGQVRNVKIYVLSNRMNILCVKYSNLLINLYTQKCLGAIMYMYSSHYFKARDCSPIMLCVQNESIMIKILC